MLISVIVPVYKVERYINRCIESILNQSFKDYELILVDDGSPDKCGKICDEYAEKKDNIYVIHKANGGLSDARNAGIEWAIENSNSEWITFIDSDDWIHKDYLKLLYDAAERLQVGVSICGFSRVTDEDMQNLPEVVDGVPKLWNTEDFFIERNVNAVVAWGKLYKKSLWKNIRYPYGKLHEDEFTTYKLLFQRDKVAVLDTELYFYYKNENGIMNSKWSPKRLDAIEAMQERMHFFATDAKYSKVYAWNINALLSNCYWNYKIIFEEKQLNERKKYLRRIKREFQKSIWKYRKNDLVNWDKVAYEYNYIFPIKSYIYWHMVALKKKICKMLSGDIEVKN